MGGFVELIVLVPWFVRGRVFRDLHPGEAIFLSFLEAVIAKRISRICFFVLSFRLIAMCHNSL